MKLKMMMAALAVSGWMLPAQAADLTAGTTANTTANAAPSTNTTTIAASSVLSPGRYMATIAPSFNGDMAGRFEKAVGKFPGVESVTSSVGDSTIHFTVKKGATVRIADIQKAVAKGYTGAVMTTPILEHSLTANPGL